MNQIIILDQWEFLGWCFNRPSQAMRYPRKALIKFSDARARALWEIIQKDFFPNGTLNLNFIRGEMKKRGFDFPVNRMLAMTVHNCDCNIGALEASLAANRRAKTPEEKTADFMWWHENLEKVLGSERADMGKNSP